MTEWDGPMWPEIIRQHREEYLRSERDQVEKAMRMYRGQAYTLAERDKSPLKLVTFNLLFAVAESSVAATVPPEMAFTVYEKPETTSTPLESYLSACGRVEDWSGEGALSMLDSVLTGRSVLKTTLTESGHATIRAVDPRRVYFDLTARRPQDISYFIEFTPMSVEDFEAKLKGRKPIYKLPPGVTDIRSRATLYPEWVSREAHLTAGQRWVPVYEVVDVRRKQVTHWLDDTQSPLTLLEGENYFQPYSLYNLNLNGQDCRGESEVILVEDVVYAINRVLSYWGELIRQQVPVTAYDNSRTTEDEVKKLAQATPGAFVGLNSAGQPPSSLFSIIPPPPVPPEIKEFMAKLEAIVSYVTALPDSARGQVVGARTATELAVIESAQKTRLGQRTARFNRAWEDAARKVLFLARAANPALPDPHDVCIVAYSPVERNREVLRERFTQALAYIAAHPDSFKQEEIDKLFTEVFNLPANVLRSPEEKLQQAQAIQQAAQAVQVQTPAPAGGQAEPSPIPPQIANQLAAAQGEANA